jgi:Xaa-Pro aminopeptidase
MIEEKLKRLRYILNESNYCGYMVSTSDEYLSEYAPAYSKRLEYITGFTGSNGLAIILPHTVLFFTDGRYINQALTQLDDHLFEVFDQQLMIDFSWIDYIQQGQKIAYDPKIFSRKSLTYLSKVNLVPDDKNLIDQIWENRPKKPNSNIYDYSTEFAGQSYETKVENCREFIKNHQSSALVITNPECVCWLLNIRAHDTEFSPLLLAHVIVTESAIYLLTDESRYDNTHRKDITIIAESEFRSVINEIEGKILFDRDLCSDYITTLIEKKQYQHIKQPCINWKAQKNSTEIKHMQEGHIQDAVAVCEMLAFIAYEEISLLSEYDLGRKLTDLRKRGKSYIMDSFPTICGFQENAAIIHYRAEKASAKKIAGPGLLLIDSGGQYLGATTDITRTIAIGKPINEHKKYYTQVLKGHIALGMSVFPENKSTGANLDILARQFLWREGKDYAHGTGHGVGSFLSVHEGPQNISAIGTHSVIKKGMVMSNEPGYYVPGAFGIRIENMMYAKASQHQGFLEFEMLTLVPYCAELIMLDMLSEDELHYIKIYYKKIDSMIFNYLSDRAKSWLNQQISVFL